MGVRPEARFVEVEDPEMNGEGDDRDDPTVVELLEPFDALVEESGALALVPSRSSGGLDRRNGGWLL